MRRVVRVLQVRDEPPVNARDATAAFNTPLRLRLIRHYIESPGQQRHAADALGVSRAVISLNTRVLVDLGVVRNDAGIYSVDLERVAELHAALGQYLLP